MYVLIYGSLYLISLLPLFLLYRISDLACFLVHRVFRYRNRVVMSNLDIAFPDKTLADKKRIAARFYRNFTDTFIETIKMLSISDRRFHRMVEFDLSEANRIAAEGTSIQFHAGHQFNWELANWAIAETMSLPFVGVYMDIKNRSLNRIFYRLRSRKGTVLVSVKEFRNRMHQLLNGPYSIGLAADQNPGVPAKAYWLNFFGRPAPFVTGPDKAAIRNNTAVIFIRLVKLKRGRYRFESEVITTQGGELKEGELTRRYRDILEQTIRAHPDNYLWSHRRWKWAYSSEYAAQWVDHAPLPQ